MTGWCSPVQFVCVIIALNWIFICEIFWKLLPQKKQKQGLRADSTSLWSMALIGGRPQSQAQQQSQQISHSQCQPTSVDGLADNSLYASSWQISHKEHCLAVLVCPQLLCSCRPLCNPERGLTVVLLATIVTLADFFFFKKTTIKTHFLYLLPFSVWAGLLCHLTPTSSWLLLSQKNFLHVDLILFSVWLCVFMCALELYHLCYGHTLQSHSEIKKVWVSFR